MREIPLTQGQVALVDDEDFEELNRFKWCASWDPCTRSFYAQRNIRLPSGKQTQQLMHRVILGLKRGDVRQGDHINHVTRDNRRENIRIVTNQENQHNRRDKGYSWCKSRRKYLACIKVDGVRKYLGQYDTAAEARAAYLSAKAIYHPTAPFSVETT